MSTGMAAEFKGKISLDIRDSEPDWGPYEAPTAPENAPNVLYVVWDDVEHIGCVGRRGRGLIGSPVRFGVTDVECDFALEFSSHDGEVTRFPALIGIRIRRHRTTGSAVLS